MKPQLLKYRYGNRAIIFTLDMLVAVTVFSIILIVSLYYVSQASENKLAKLQMINAASDILAVMDYNGTLQTLNSTLIEEQRNTLLPIAYKMRILIETSNGESIDIGEINPEGTFTATGKRFFIVGEDYGEATYWIWPKQ